MPRARKLIDLSPIQSLIKATARALDAGDLRDVLSALPDEAAAVRLLNARLSTVRLRLHPDDASGSWHMESVEPVATSRAHESDDGALGLARLVEADGWHRIKFCPRGGCSRAFVDLTNGSNRKYCDMHRPRANAHGATRSRDIAQRRRISQPR